MAVGVCTCQLFGAARRAVRSHSDLDGIGHSSCPARPGAVCSSDRHITGILVNHAVACEHVPGPCDSPRRAPVKWGSGDRPMSRSCSDCERLGIRNCLNAAAEVDGCVLTSPRCRRCFQGTTYQGKGQRRCCTRGGRRAQARMAGETPGTGTSVNLGPLLLPGSARGSAGGLASKVSGNLLRRAGTRRWAASASTPSPVLPDQCPVLLNATECDVGRFQMGVATF